MEFLEEKTVGCPYCGESISVLITPEDSDQEYIEDCQVCCRPITFVVAADASGDSMVSVYGENDTH